MDTEMKARIQGMSAQMKKIEFFFGVWLGLLILRHTNNLSRTEQKGDTSAAEGQEVVSLTLTTLKSICSDASFDLFWQRVCASAEEVDVDKPILPRRRKLPHRLDDGAAPTIHATVEEHYHVKCFEAVDLITSCVSNRFDQPGYKTYAKVQNLLKAATSQPYEEEMRFIISFYGSDFNSFLLSTHLEIFSQNFQQATKVTFPGVIDFFCNYSATQVTLMSEVSKLVRLLLVMPATNAQSERSFSTVRRLKTCLRSSMTQQRLNHLMLLHIHKYHTNNLDLIDVAHDFIDGNEHRKNFFGLEFKQTDRD